MNTTEDNASTTPDEAQAEQTPTWSTAEAMFPLPDGASPEETNEILAKRTKYEELLEANATQAETIAEQLAQKKVQADANARALKLGSVAQKVLAQLSTLVDGEELSSEFTSTDGLFSRFTSKKATFTVRLAGDAVRLDLKSVYSSVKGITLTIDEEGLDFGNTVMVMGYLTITPNTKLPKRAMSQPTMPDSTTRLLERLASQGGFPAYSTMMSLSGLLATIEGNCGNPYCPVPWLPH